MKRPKRRLEEGAETVRALWDALANYVDGADWDCVANTEGEYGCGHCDAIKAMKQAEDWLHRRREEEEEEKE